MQPGRVGRVRLLAGSRSPRRRRLGSTNFGRVYRHGKRRAADRNGDARRGRYNHGCIASIDVASRSTEFSRPGLFGDQRVRVVRRIAQNRETRGPVCFVSRNGEAIYARIGKRAKRRATRRERREEGTAHRPFQFRNSGPMENARYAQGGREGERDGRFARDETRASDTRGILQRGRWPFV